MFVQADRGNCSFLVRCKQPLVNGLQLNVSLFSTLSKIILNIIFILFCIGA